MPFTVDPEFAAAYAAVFPNPSPTLPISDVQRQRDDFVKTFNPLLATQFPRIPTISRKDYFTKSADGHEVLLRWYSKPNSNPGSALVFIHSGGLILADISTFDGLVDEYVHESGVPYLSVEYRLAPEHRYPKALEDVYAGLSWLHTHAAELGVDPSRIGVHGESAGGGLAAALAIYARENGGLPIAKQVLVYPMLDDRVAKSDPFIKPYLVWSAAANETAWDAYLGPGHRVTDVPATAAPARLTNPVGLPPLYAEVGELDLFRDQVLEYAHMFVRAGVSAELHLFPGVPHGFEWFAPRSRIGSAALRARIQAVESI